MIGISTHAIDRYIERVKPCLTADQAREEIQRLLETVVGFSQTPPAWHEQGRDVAPFDSYAMVGDSIAFPVRHGWVITCLTRGGHSDEVREARNRRHQARRQTTAKKRRSDRQKTIRDRAGKPRRKDWDAAA